MRNVKTAALFGAAAIAVSLFCARTTAAPALDDPENAKVLIKPAITVEHGDVVLCIAFNPDGKRIASAGPNKAIKVWDAGKGEELLTLNGHNDAVLSVAYSPDGRMLASAGQDGVILGWDAAAGRLLYKLGGHKGAVRCLAYSADGKSLASGGADQSVNCWDGATGKLVRRFQGHEEAVQSVRFSSDGKYLASASGEDGKPGVVKICELATGKETLSLTEGKRCVAFSPDSKTLVAADGSDDSLKGKKQLVNIWDAESGKRLVRLKAAHPGEVIAVAFRPDGKIVASAAEKKVFLSDADSGRLLLVINHGDTITSMAFSPDGKRLVTAGKDKSAKIWDVAAELKTDR
jgi:WD40 repeat protein